MDPTKESTAQVATKIRPWYIIAEVAGMFSLLIRKKSLTSIILSKLETLTLYPLIVPVTQTSGAALVCRVPQVTAKTAARKMRRLR